MGSFAFKGFRPSVDGLTRFLRWHGNFGRLSEHKPVALQIVLHLLASGGSSELSEVNLSIAVKRSPSAVSASLVWLEQSGAVTVARRSAGGVRLASLRSVNVAAAFDVFAGVLAGVARSIASCVRRVRILAVRRSYRPRPSERVLLNCHTPDAGADRLEHEFLEYGLPNSDPCQLLSRYRQGLVCLSLDRVSGLVSEGAALMGLTSDEYRKCFGL